MLKSALILALVSVCTLASAQTKSLAYTVIEDSLMHTSVVHSSDSALVAIRHAYAEQGLFVSIAPDTHIKNGIVDHRGQAGDIYVREYFSSGKLVGYIQYDDKHKPEREIYFNRQGDIYLEKRYVKGSLKYKNDTVRHQTVLSEPIKSTHDNPAK